MKEILKDIGIYDLRNYARNIGVKSPTTKRKDQLILEIENIKSSGKVSGYIMKQGRRPKVFPQSINEDFFKFNSTMLKQFFDKDLKLAIKNINEIKKQLIKLKKLIE